MSLDSSKVIVPGHGRFWLGPVDTLPPGQLVKITGSPTQAVVTLTVNAVAAAAATLKSTDTVAAKMAALANALAAITTVGSGNVVILPGPDAWSFLIILDPAVTSPTITAAATYTGGSTPGITVTSTTVGRSADFSGLSEIGHTSNDNPLQVNRSGGDVTSVGSWQQDNIDSSQAPVTESLAFSLLQYDLQSMKLYYGSNALLAADGSLYTNPSGAAATETALFLIIKNGAKAQARHWPRVSISAADGENFDISKLSEMPIQASVLSSNTLTFGKAISPVGVAA
jgi:hypothetical protein